MRHAEVQAQLADYLEGDLSLAKRARIDAHFDSCEGCSRDLAELRQIVSLIRGLPTPEPPADLVDSVIARVRAGEGRVRLWDRVSSKLAELSSPIFTVPASAVAIGLIAFVMTEDLGGVLGPDRVASLAEQRSASQIERSGEPAPSDAQAADPVTPGVERRLRSDQASAPLQPLPQGGLARGGRSSERLLPRDPMGMGGPFRGSNSGAKLVPVNGGSGPGASPIDLVTPGIPLSDPRDPAEQDQWREDELDGRIAIALADPVFFARDLAQRSLAERELWLRVLADRARETGRVEAVEKALRTSGDAIGLAIADEFARANALLRAHIATGDAESSARPQDAAR